VTREEMIDEAVRRCTKPATRKAIANREDGLGNCRSFDDPFRLYPGRLKAIRAEFQKLAR
jgi:hypothetical protein